jgi:general secretion pathway protein A
MYLAHFGFTEWPFSNTPDPRFVYLSPRHEEALAHLLYGVRERGGFVQLTGEVGTGKTTICRYLLSRLPEGVDVALVLNPMLTPEELLATVCDELGVPYPAETRTRKVYVDALYQHLLAAHGRGRRTVLIIDEAQNLSAGAIEQLRLLTNLETATEKLLQIILIGQPELVELLDQPKLRQVAQRITARYHLLPFEEKDTQGYVWRRLRIAGQRIIVFEPRAIAAVHRASRGVPRLINVICDRALLGAFAEGAQSVSPRMVRRAAREVSGERTPTRRWPWRTTAAAGLMTAAIAATGLAGLWPVPDTWRRLAAAPVAGSLRSATAALASTAGAAPAGALGAVPGAVTAGAPAAVTAGAAAAGPSGEPVTALATPAAPGPAPSGGAMSASGVPTVAAVRIDAAGANGVAAVTPAHRAPRTASDLGALLEAVRPASDRSAALSRVLLRWGVDPAKDDPCRTAARADLRCWDGHGSWTALRRLGVPAAIKLLAPDGALQWAAVTGLDDDAVTLELRDRVHTVPRASVERLWDGAYTVVWRPLPGALRVLTPGVQGPEVAWLRKALGDGEVAARPAVYDSALAGRVAAFQRSEGLEPDGVAGIQTLLRLSIRSDRRTPVLSATAAAR